MINEQEIRTESEEDGDWQPPEVVVELLNRLKALREERDTLRLRMREIAEVAPNSLRMAVIRDASGEGRFARDIAEIQALWVPERVHADLVKERDALKKALHSHEDDDEA